MKNNAEFNMKSLGGENNMLYVMSDLHGEYEGFMNMLDKIGFGSGDKMYVLGDVIDRGRKPIYLLEFILEQCNIEMLLGNHEEMFLSYLCNRKDSILNQWLDNGGGTTLFQYEMLPPERKNNLLGYLQGLQLYKIVDDFILVHAGINAGNIRGNTVEEIMEWQKKDDLLWVRSDFYRSPALVGKTIIFGHTPTFILHGRCTIWHDEKYGDKIGIDCGRAYGGKIGCLRLDDMEEFYV
ncbi:MAG TPA: metallophosphoesterase [Bacillota bacterium]|nr:metallophosphoesterase [Bacillota bacterium]